VTDILIAGGGLAGSSLAVMLGRKGFNVELFDRARFPREKPCGEGLMPGGIAILDRLGLAEQIGGAPFNGVRYHFNGRFAVGQIPKVAGFPHTGKGQRRNVLDNVVLSTAALTPGVRVHTDTRIEAPIVEEGRVVGLIVEGQKIRAPLVVAADGTHSSIREKLGLSGALGRNRFGVRAHFRLAKRSVQEPWVDILVGAGHEVYVTPLPNNEVTVALLAEAASCGENCKTDLLRRCQAFPMLASRLEGAEQVSVAIGASPLSGSARSGVARGVVLLGDAAGFVDPVTGGGMTQALMTAELLAGYISSNQPGDDKWLWSFERERRHMLRDYHFLTQAVLRFSGKPRVTHAVLSVLQRWPSLLSRGIAVSGGIRGLLSC
jgi:menaquinone-9 beta-reductase